MVNFNFSFAPGTSLQQMVGIELAGRIWSSYLRDPVTLNIHVSMARSSDLPTHVIGGALPGIRARQSYNQFGQRLTADATSTNDSVAIQNWQDDDKFTALIDGVKVDNNASFKMTRANAKAVGMLGANDTALDGYILLSDLAGYPVSWSYDYQRTQSAAANSLDFLSTALHEVGHILGFVSGVDKPGWLTQRVNYDGSSIDDYYSSLIGTLEHATPLDLFRYSSQSAAERWIDLSIGGNPYFSIDGGRTALARFATGQNISLGGNGYQASHWAKQANRIGIMDPTLSIAERGSLSMLDLQAMDVIGWNLRSNPGSFTVDLSSLRTQAEQALAQRLGQTVTWLHANATTASQLLSQDRTQAIGAMITSSEVYEWGTRPPSTGTTPPPPPNPWRQILDLFQSQGLFATFPTLESEISMPKNASTTAQVSEASVSMEVSQLAAGLNVRTFEIVMPKTNTTAVMPEVETVSVCLEKIGDIGAAITVGQIDVKQWLDRFERSVRQKQTNASQPGSGTENAIWEITDWTNV